MGSVSTGMGDRFGALLVSLMALWLTLIDLNPFRLCCHLGTSSLHYISPPRAYCSLVDLMKEKVFPLIQNLVLIHSCLKSFMFEFIRISKVKEYQEECVLVCLVYLCRIPLNSLAEC